ncbi:Uncharacterized protein OS=Planctomyces brasiliensis (strain ATCC 49424 / DSM 5305 / JCM 21570 / NBRC 103401 / IFAM 1448) GN=Plabr_3606 PE=4 SV=1: DUF692 [Gemmata massiliana]|uniref:DUF692 domain-containing protein n=1 Tax=Gemmata massiliana TaxID=1210884 RepID=A0A6P2D444_9BACT|nr:DUF692 family multinuclear iron-containing protein [Gemmata massiliana]VTR96078.1 Uncharacterized protein OS=Planctomyces brasiliensis (strain ATCC 49424 / DSM 5305 / JCM 21570 / NBRC 103401 / IFAM 1448) GN=Plabr_3606 PE=4 SV=1: DUF692 [Gemmata massiliana]
MVPATGYGLREPVRGIYDEPALTGVEITFEQADDPLSLQRYIGDEREFDYVSVHALKLSVASADPPRRDYMDALLAIARENGAVSVSDHLGFTRAGERGAEMGHFAPPPYTHAALDATCRNIDTVMRHFGDLNFFLENIAYTFRFKAEMEEREFLIRTLQRTGCGWLLDVTNVYANSVNHKYDPYEFIREVMPFAPRVEMHLAGGLFNERLSTYVDSHSEPIPKEVWDLYRYSLEQGRGKVEAVFIERDANFPDETGWRSEVRTARDIALEVEART